MSISQTDNDKLVKVLRILIYGRNNLTDKDIDDIINVIKNNYTKLNIQKAIIYKNPQDNNDTLMSILCENLQQPKVFEFFLDNGGDKALIMQNNNGITPMHLACVYQTDPRIFKLLLSHGGDKALTMKNSDGITPMHYASSNQTDPRIFELLLSHGGHKALTIKNNNGYTPMFLLKNRPNKKPIIKEFIKHFDREYLKRAERRGTIFSKIKALFEANPNILNEYVDKGYAVMDIFSEEYLKKKIIEKQEKREKERVKKIRYVKELTRTPNASETSSSLPFEKLVGNTERKNLKSHTRKSRS
jgi:ankyrin repeat protein